MPVNSSSPIGIFDSGIGGLTVADAIRKKLPGEHLIYFGDTAHLPYGDKSPDSIKYYSIRISQFLLDQGAKMIVIACNTASSIAYSAVRDFVGKKAIVVNVIDPVVEAVANAGYNKIGVIGTKGTIKSGIYNMRLKEENPELKVESLATPLLAPMIEEGFFNNRISNTVIHSYLSRPRLKKIDALILACTHYPLIRNEIENYYEDKVEIIDSAEIVAAHILKILTSKKKLHKGRRKSHCFYVSDYTTSFQKSTRFFFKEKIMLEEVSFWT